MRKLFALLYFVALSVDAATPITINFSGKIKNTTEKTLKIRGESYEKDIALKSDGSFSEKFQIDYAGAYALMIGQHRAALYLAKGTDLVFTADANDFYKTIRFSGKGSPENQYIASKNAYVNEINQEKLYSLDEAAFLKELEGIKKDLLLLFDHGKFPESAFKKSELRNIDYLSEMFLLSYPRNHAHFAKLSDYKTPDDFPKPPTTDFDNEADFLFSNPYKQLVNINFNERMDQLLKPEDQFLWRMALPEIKKVQSPSIRNSLLNALSYEVTAANPDAQALYDELMRLSTNPYFKKELTDNFNKIKALATGTVSPVFDFENHAGGKTSLESLKGKYVYIDVWATWCGPCLREIPALLQIEEKYKDRNITFVSLSVDTKRDYDKWKKMVTEKQLAGVQLIADDNWNSKFVQDYAIVSIPRFILIDADGKIVNADAPRPSDPALETLFAGLKL